jgi:hypothetical protein
MQLVVFVLLISTIVLVIVGILYILWRELVRPFFVYLIAKGILQSPLRGAPKANRQPVSGLSSFLYFIGIGILSTLLAFAEAAVTKMNTPGDWVMGRLATTANQKGDPYDLSAILFLPIVLDACLIFVVLWAIHSWIEARSRDH